MSDLNHHNNSSRMNTDDNQPSSVVVDKIHDTFHVTCKEDQSEAALQIHTSSEENVLKNVCDSTKEVASTVISDESVNKDDSGSEEILLRNRFRAQRNHTGGSVKRNQQIKYTHEFLLDLRIPSFDWNHENDKFSHKLKFTLESFPTLVVKGGSDKCKPKHTSNRSHNNFIQRNTGPTSKINDRPSLENVCDFSNDKGIFHKDYYKKDQANCIDKKVKKDIERYNQITDKSKEKYEHIVDKLFTSDSFSFKKEFIENRKEFLELLPHLDSIPGKIPQIVSILLKIFEIEDCRQTVLPVIVNDNSLDKMMSCITLFPAEYNENILSKEEVVHFVENVFKLSEDLIKLQSMKLVSVANKLLRTLQYCLRGLDEHHNFCLSKLYCEKITSMVKQSNLTSVKNRTSKNEKEDLLEPPDSIRSIDIFPNKQDLFENPIFLRKNVVDGSYKDVDHYVDVQFRLLREDFIAPLRNGVQQYFQNLTEKTYDKNVRFDNIRIHEDVKILHGTITNGRFGHLVQLSTKVSNNFSRFMFGSLLLFTSDCFQSFFCATVIESVNDDLLVVDISNKKGSAEEIYSTNYIMVESEIYFEPYFHVLSALQEIDDSSLPMKKYIVNVEPQTKSLQMTETNDCPSFLNKSQQKAFISAMNDDFVAIQGPPGTGKTYLALYITKTLLKALELKFNFVRECTRMFYDSDDDSPLYSDYDSEVEFEWDSRNKGHRNRNICLYNKAKSIYGNKHSFFLDDKRYGPPFLVICYTNHALDQFLEGLLPFTNRVIRVGGQSKNCVIQHYNLREVRSAWLSHEKSMLRRCYCYKCEKELIYSKNHVRHFEEVQEISFSYLLNLKLLESVSERGILKMEFISRWMPPQFRVLLQGELFENWLLEGFSSVDIPFNTFEDHSLPNTIQTHHLLSDLRKSQVLRHDFEIDNFETRVDECVEKHFSCTVKNLKKQSSNLDSKLRKLRRRGVEENVETCFQSQIDHIELTHRYISYMLRLKGPVDMRTIRNLSRTSNVWSIEYSDRWNLYNFWIQHFIHSIKEEMMTLEDQLAMKKEMLSGFQNLQDEKILKMANVIGMTTTGGARLREILTAIGPETVIVEEAAEVLEAHIVASLVPSVKKVILIGDHKQLRPSPAVYKLAQQYKLDISLFERMINNGLGCQTLDTQHRMRPEIASLIVPAIYPDLKNDESVYNREGIRGVASSVFFVNHDHPEDIVADSSSRRNAYEVEFIISLCEYLFLQGYLASEITILATYAGQMTSFERERRKRNLPEDLRISTVDNYQGEENRIILLSLVRSNKEASIGFLSADNRVCVALSRARDGLFIIGNMENMTRSSKIWKQVKTQLEKINGFGSTLPLGCKKHPDSRCFVTNGKDFKGVPVGGCLVKCDTRLSCNHVCPQFCHSLDPDHEDKYSCPSPCERMACPEHRCTKRCGENCGDCTVVVEKILPCKHIANLMCSIDPEKHYCTELVTVLGKCNHEVRKECGRKAVPSCQVPCPEVLKCGHVCEKRCHVGIHSCSEIVNKTLVCGHISIAPCAISDESLKKRKCKEPCLKMFPCGHACDKLCCEDCSTCDASVEKFLPKCGHVVMVKCGAALDTVQCSQPCKLKMPCGHKCPSPCFTECSAVSCQEMVQSVVEAGCGHGFVRVPCHINMQRLHSNSDMVVQFCLAPCRDELPCGHICKGSCGECFQGRIHVPCTEMCSQTLPCGHKCEEPCGNECPVLCNKPCQNRCQHQTCSAICGEPCVPCQKPCTRSCKHQKCCQPCSQSCDCKPCTLPCSLFLACGHPCLGFCGEPCPDYCPKCLTGDSLTSPSAAESQSSRFVLLEDCGHCIEDQLLCDMITKGTAENQLGKCPACRESVVQTNRFKESVGIFFRNLRSLKSIQKRNITIFTMEMKTKIATLKLEQCDTDKYGEGSLSILEHLKQQPYVYKSSKVMFIFYTLLKAITDTFTCENKDSVDCQMVTERCKLIMRALSLRLNSISLTDKRALLAEIKRLEVATKNWPTHRDLLLSLEKYSL